MQLDTNTIIRFVIGEPEEQFQKIKAVMIDAADRKINLELKAMVLAECVFVLSSVYEKSRKEISSLLIAFVSVAEVELHEPELLKLALKLYGSRKLDFVDCYLAAISIINGEEVLSFDKDFGKVDGVKWINPTSYK